MQPQRWLVPRKGASLWLGLNVGICEASLREPFAIWGEQLDSKFLNRLGLGLCQHFCDYDNSAMGVSKLRAVAKTRRGTTVHTKS